MIRVALSLFVALSAVAGRSAQADEAAASVARLESVEADISTRTVAVRSDFVGTEIIVFGAVHNSRQAAREDGLYDVAVVVEGPKASLTARRKSRVAGVWANTEWVRFEGLPTFYAISTTRPLAEIAPPDLLERLDVGFEEIMAAPNVASASLDGMQTAGYRQAVIRLKREENLYVREDYGVSFIGRGLFRATIALPANVPVGTLDARIYLLRDGRLLSEYSAQVRLSREGIERHIHDFAHRYPALYGIVVVLIAAGAGLAASAFASRRT